MVGSRRVQGAESAPTEGALGAPPHVGHRRRRVFTAEDGWVWTFAAVDHWNAECVGWGIHPSFGFVEEPETNGVVERWNRTLKECLSNLRRNGASGKPGTVHRCAAGGVG